jgi:hypothetical protein
MFQSNYVYMCTFGIEMLMTPDMIAVECGHVYPGIGSATYFVLEEEIRFNFKHYDPDS